MGADGGQQDVRARGGISPAQEKQIARGLSPEVAWPTLALAAFLPLAFAAVAAAGWTRAWPLLACVPVLTLVSYAHYTLVHEAIHGNVVSGRRGPNWINTAVGWIGALGMGTGWPALQRTHVLHHAHTNTERDPDIQVKGTFWRLVAKWARNLPSTFVPIGLLRFTAPDRYRRLGTILSPREIALMSAVTLAQIALLAAAVATGRLLEWTMLWFLPTRLGILLLNIFFQWLPHHPFDRTERYHNTRISLWPGGGVILLQQNLHLMHHLWPSVPFYNYGRLYRALRPVLLAEGSRIEGLRVGRPPRGGRAGAR